MITSYSPHAQLILSPHTVTSCSHLAPHQPVVLCELRRYTSSYSHYTSLHLITPHYTALHRITPHHTVSYPITPHHISSYLAPHQPEVPCELRRELRVALPRRPQVTP